MNENKTYYIGWYSQMAADAYGTCIWEDVFGRQFEVTAVEDQTNEEYKYGWSDKVAVAINLVKCVSSIQKRDTPTVVPVIMSVIVIDNRQKD